MTRDQASPASLTPEVAEAIASWVPHSLRDIDAATLEAVMPVVREMVAAAEPKTPYAAKRILWALTPLAAHLYRKLGVFDAATLNHDNVVIWLTQINADRGSGWLTGARAALKKVGVAVNSPGWPRQQKQVPRQAPVEAYTPRQEADYIDAAALPGFERPEAPLWVVGGGLGAAMNGVELAATEIDDLQELGDGRLAVQVRGRNPRLVPIRGCCTDIVRRAVNLVEQRPPRASRRFILAEHHNAGARIANSVTIGRNRGLSLPRARSTFLAAHLRAGTPLIALRKIAGPVSTVTLNDLIAAFADTITAEEAVAQGLRA